MTRDGVKNMWRILLVDDSEALLALLRSYLEEEGYIVHSTSQADHAIRLVEKEEVDLVIADIFMPMINGFELSKKIRGKVPVILMTAGESEVLQKDIADHSDAFLHKVIERGQLIGAVTKAIERWKLEHEGELIRK